MRIHILRSPLLLILVLSTAFAEANAETREVRQAGRCNLADYPWPKKSLEVTATAAMSYKVQLSTGIFANGEWAIFAPLSISNETGKRLYVQYYVAFFDRADRLVGCCQQGAEATPALKNLQLASCVIQGPKEQLLSATKYQVAVFESDRPIGEEPISVEDADALPGGSGGVTTLLTGAVLKQAAPEGPSVLHLSADCSFAEIRTESKDTHLEVKGARLRDFYLSTGKRERLVVSETGGKKTETILHQWLMNANLETKSKAQGADGNYWQGVGGIAHVALLDRQGRLVVCGPVVGLGSTHDLVAPKDRLLSASTLRMVIYESAATAAKQDK
ncbi:MAG TPA: hypothetical protein VHB77_17720 [Planctomycetaceae bacterium]|nr:hypothetical protein [Planctomycetaceae bacterium]